jgi:hypothetical protein
MGMGVGMVACIDRVGVVVVVGATGGGSCSE